MSGTSYPSNMLKLAILSCLLALAYGKTIEDGSRIIGGEAIDIGQAPYQLAMQRDHWGIGIWGFHCGGVIISETKGLTAAHCTTVYAANRLRVRVGSTTQAAGGVVIAIESVVNHDGFSTVTVANDIAVLNFAQALVFSNLIQPAVLADSGFYPESDASAHVSGWGSIIIGGSAATILRRATVPIVDRETCNQLYDSHILDILPDMLCAGWVGVGGIDACTGDSGGPLVVDDVLVGLVSWADSCALPDRPGVYASIGYHRDWITQNS